MEQVIAKTRQDHLPTGMLEPQNINVNTICFYGSMGFSIDAIDCSPPHCGNFRDKEVWQVAFYMKQMLE